MQAILDVLDTIREADNDKPKGLVLQTTKGRGVSYMEDICSWHGQEPNEEQFNQAMTELEKGLDL